MRGKDQSRNPAAHLSGITPAYAGKSICFMFLYWLTMGSPPPMRGKVVAMVDSVGQPRITPAYAGKSCYVKMDRCTKLGSPPPMRGKGILSPYLAQAPRITPAYAGKSTQILWNCFFDQDHPRLCGEKLLITSKAPFRAGSPPPMRGKA